MELELKHIMPYIPYGVLGYFQDEDDGTNYYATKIDISCIEWLMSDGTIILRPLSDLTKEIEVNGEKFVPMDIIKIYHYCTIDSNGIVTESGEEYGVKYLPYTIVEMLISWHFDVFGLIEAGLAIDMNSLNQK